MSKPEEMQTRAGTQAEKILNRLLTSDRAMSVKELNADRLVGGSVAANRKTVQRMKNRGLIIVERTDGSRRGRPEEFYAPAGSPRGESVKPSGLNQTPSAGTGYKQDTQPEVDMCPVYETGSLERTPDSKVDTCPTEPECPVYKPSDANEFDPSKTGTTTPHARDASFDKWEL